MEFLELFTQSSTYISLVTLTFMEIVLGIDNIIFISILTSKVEESQRERARVIGLTLALVFRVILLFSIVWIASLIEPLFSVFGHPVTGRDLILICGGLFLLAKSTLEIHSKLEGEEDAAAGKKPKAASFMGVIVQIGLLDIVFSFDSVITAIGLVDHISIMIVAVILSMIVMFIFAKSVSEFIHKHPTIKMLALSFLIMIGLLLFLEGLHVEVPKGYVYFAMAFSLFVELLNMKLRKKKTPPIQLRNDQLKDK